MKKKIIKGDRCLLPVIIIRVGTPKGKIVTIAYSNECNILQHAGVLSKDLIPVVEDRLKWAYCKKSKTYTADNFHNSWKITKMLSGYCLYQNGYFSGFRIKRLKTIKRVAELLEFG